MEGISPAAAVRISGLQQNKWLMARDAPLMILQNMHAAAMLRSVVLGWSGVRSCAPLAGGPRRLMKQPACLVSDAAVPSCGQAGSGHGGVVAHGKAWRQRRPRVCVLHTTRVLL